MKRFLWFQRFSPTRSTRRAVCSGDFCSRNVGFTLIEILVVVAIVALVAGILLPVFSRVRENARRTSCLSNLKQIAAGALLYLQDYERRYPPVPTNTDGSVGWALDFSNEAKSDAIFQCPSETKDMGEGFTDYWINGNLLGLHEIRIQSPTSVLLAGDGDTNAVDYALPSTDYGDWQIDALYSTRHLGGAGYAFADGHVKWLNSNSVSLTAPPGGGNATFVPG